MLNVEMLSTGDEVLHGQIIDTNAAWLSDYFFHQGIPLTSRSTVGDNIDRLVQTLALRSQYADILIVNGGLGPTQDDLSAEAAALALGVELEERSEWTERMTQWFAKRERAMAASNIKQAMLPRGAELIDNPIGSACGFSITLNDCLIFFTPGVPSEFKMMVQQQIMPRLQQRFILPKPPICLRMTTFGCSESQLAQLLDGLVLPDDTVLGYRSASPIIEIKLTGPAERSEEINSLWQQVKELVDTNIIYEGLTNLPDIVVGLLNEKNLTVAISEQFTAGLVNLQLNNAKATIKGSRSSVADSTLCLTELAKSASKIKSAYGSDISVAIGAKQLNHIDLALATLDITYAVRFYYNGYSHSLENQQQTVAMLMLDMLRRWLNGWPVTGRYEWLEVVETESFYQ